jgi:hypothetical protein
VSRCDHWLWFLTCGSSFFRFNVRTCLAQNDSQYDAKMSAGAIETSDKRAGILAALLGALIALVSARAMSAQESLIESYVVRTDAIIQAQSTQTQQYLLQSQLTQLHALSPLDGAAFEKQKEQLKQLTQAPNPAASNANQAVLLSTELILASVAPNDSQVTELKHTLEFLSRKHLAADAWAQSYVPLLHVQQRAIHTYEWILVATELSLGLVSVYLLFGRKLLLLLAMASAAICFVSLIGVVAVNNLRERELQQQVDAAQQRCVTLSQPLGEP